jgi:aminoglycoside phosphotransferase (APT) family kinase protein
MMENQMSVAELVDRAGPIRPGEELDSARLEAYLRTHLPEVQGALEIRQYPSGHSNLTYALRLGDKKLVLRRPPFGSTVKSAHDMGREFRVLSKLHAAYTPTPEVVLYCEDLSVMGAPFYLMQPIEGLILRSELPKGLEFTHETAQGLSEAFLDNLVALHHVDYKAAGLSDLGRPDGYMERQVRGWADRYNRSKTQVNPEVGKLVPWMEANLPKASAASLIHNDYKYDNVILDPTYITNIVGVLDWEMSTIGDSLADLGSALAYWTEASDPDWIISHSHGPTALPGSLTRAELVQRYALRTGRDVSQIGFYLTFARFKIAVILQQIYFRYQQGLTHDERFATLPERVEFFLQSALECIQTGRI